jgi:hypothetical protein
MNLTFLLISQLFLFSKWNLNLQSLWPKWIQKNGIRKQCITDSDCKFPSACCNHPIIPGNKYCCTGGYKKRELVKAYIYQPVYSNNYS